MSTRDALEAVIQLAEEHTGRTLRHYRRATLYRRAVARRLSLGLADDEQYLELVQRDPLELHQLSEFFNIPTTEMYRDPETWDAVRSRLFVQLFQRRAREGARVVRVWCAGCSTGEEALTLAACALDARASSGCSLDVEILASDVSAPVLERAARMRVPMRRATHAPPDLVARYFDVEDDTLVARPELRAIIGFCRHDILDRDRVAPAASVVASFDVVSCRNVLIYFDSAAAELVLNRLFKVCAPNGLVLLGSAEALPARFADLADEVRGTRHAYWRTSR